MRQGNAHKPTLLQLFMAVADSDLEIRDALKNWMGFRNGKGKAQ